MDASTLETMSDSLVRFVHISDTHLILPGQVLDYSDIPPEWAHYARQILALPYDSGAVVAALVREINALPFEIDFVLHTGDIAGQLRSPEDYRVFCEMMRAIKYPVHYLPGNHDDLAGMQRFLCGQPVGEPFDHEFEVNGVVFACLDTRGDDPPHSGWLDDSQLTWIDAICSRDDPRPLVVALHHNPLPLGVPWLDELRLLNGDCLHQVLLKARGRLCGVFCGHVHHAVDMFHEGIFYSSVASACYQFAARPGVPHARLLDGADPGYSLVTIGAQGTAVHHQTYRLNPE